MQNNIAWQTGYERQAAAEQNGMHINDKLIHGMGGKEGTRKLTAADAPLDRAINPSRLAATK